MNYDARVAALHAAGLSRAQARQQAFREAMQQAHIREEQWHDDRGCC